MESDYHTNLFVDLDVSEKMFLQMLAEQVGCTGVDWDLECGKIELYARTNDSYVVGKKVDDFVYFKFLVDVDSDASEIELEVYLKDVGRVMLVLRDMGARVVAACEWEERLPGGGRLGVDSLGPVDS